MCSVRSLLVLTSVLGVAEASRIQPSKHLPRVSSSLRNISLHGTNDSTEEKKITQQSDFPTVPNSSFMQTSSEVTATIKGWVTAVLDGDPDRDSSTKTNRIIMIIGISVGVIAFFCCSCCVMDKFMGGGGRSRKYTHIEEDLCPRIPHLHEKKVIYEWDQNSTVINIYMKPPASVDKKDLEIKISSRKLKVGRKGKPPFLQEDLFATIIEQESNWRLRSNGELKINLRKAKNGEWPKALVHKSDQATEKSSWIA